MSPLVRKCGTNLKEGGRVQILPGDVDEEIALLLHEDDYPGGRVVVLGVGVHDAYTVHERTQLFCHSMVSWHFKASNLTEISTQRFTSNILLIIRYLCKSHDSIEQRACGTVSGKSDCSKVWKCAASGRRYSVMSCASFSAATTFLKLEVLGQKCRFQPWFRDPLSNFTQPRTYFTYQSFLFRADISYISYYSNPSRTHLNMDRKTG